MTNSLDSYKDCSELNPDAKLVEHRNQISPYNSTKNPIETATKLKESEETCFDTLTDVTVVDWYKETPALKLCISFE